MLSRVADRLYWGARYLERSEGLAHAVSAYTQFILDVPKDPRFRWDILIKIIDGEAGYYSRYSKVTENNVIKYIFLDEENLGSLKASVRFARENLRTTRDVLPEEAWELVNELYLKVNNEVDGAVKRSKRFAFLEEVMLRRLQISGLYDGSMNRDQSYDFIRLGSYLERCDMTTRMLDIGMRIPAETVENEGEQAESRDISLWSNLLDSLSAKGAYRRYIGPIVEPIEVVEFLFKYEEFPRSVRYCLNRIHRLLSRFNNHSAAIAIVEKMIRKLERFNVRKRSQDEIHAFIDALQYDLIHLHTKIEATWFNPEKK